MMFFHNNCKKEKREKKKNQNIAMSTHAVFTGGATALEQYAVLFHISVPKNTLLQRECIFINCVAQKEKKG